jgi:hypothetical protein
MKLSWSYDPGREYDKLTRVDLSRNIFYFNITFKKDIVLNFFELSNVFTGYLWTYQID